MDATFATSASKDRKQSQDWGERLNHQLQSNPGNSSWQPKQAKIDKEKVYEVGHVHAQAR